MYLILGERRGRLRKKTRLTRKMEKGLRPKKCTDSGQVTDPSTSLLRLCSARAGTATDNPSTKTASRKKGCLFQDSLCKML